MDADQPLVNRRGLVGRIIVQHQVQVQVGRGHLVDGLEESQELLLPVAAVGLPDYLAGGHIQRGEQTGGAVAHIVVGATLAPSLRVAAGGGSGT